MSYIALGNIPVSTHTINNMAFLFNLVADAVHPVVEKVTRIAPHLSEIAKIVIKPVNRVRELSREESAELSKKLARLEEKFFFKVGEDLHKIHDRNSEQIIPLLDQKINMLEKELERLFFVPILKSLVNSKPLIHTSEQSDFLTFYDNHLKESMQLKNLDIYHSYEKKLMIDELCKGMRFLLDRHPRRVFGQNCFVSMSREPGRIEEEIITGEKEFLSLVMFMNQLYKELDIFTVPMTFSTQFRTFRMGDIHCLVEIKEVIGFLREPCGESAYEIIINKLIEQISTVMTILERTSRYDQVYWAGQFNYELSLN